MRNLALMWVLAGVAVALLAAGDGKPPVSTYTDKRDGKVYKIVQIGSQTWMAQNLNYAAKGSKCYGEGGKVIIGYSKDDNAITTTLSNAEVQANCAKYGRLYDWETALTACPAGTHLPTVDEWTTLMNIVGGSKTAGKKLKSTAGWNINGNGTDDYGFAALPGGVGDSDGYFDFTGYLGCWWSATEFTAYYAWYRYTVYDTETVYRNFGNKTNLQSVRCVLDDGKEERK